MKRSDLDHAFFPTPRIFSQRVEETLLTLKEDEPVKKFTLRTVLIALPLTMLLCGIAFAVVSMQGQERYFDSIFTYYQENEPKIQQEIFDHLQTEVSQEPSEDSMGLVNVTVQDYAWVPSQNLFTISFAARVKDSDAYELHPMMDTDGMWTSRPASGNEEDRTEHWLFAEKGSVPPESVMDDPDRKLLLADMDSPQVWIGDSGTGLNTSNFFSFRDKDGAVIAVMKIELRQQDAAYLRHGFQAMESTPSPEQHAYLHLDDSGDAVAKLQEALAVQGYYPGSIDGLYSESVRSAVMAFQKANGLVSDGAAGPATQAKLYAAATTHADSDKLESTPSPEQHVPLLPGDSGDAVQKLQEALAAQGYYQGNIDGLYSESVHAAVMAFQKANQLVSDGIAGPATQSKIYAASTAREGGAKEGSPQPTDTSSADMQEIAQLSPEHAEAASAAIEQYTDPEGMLVLRLPYQIVPFENGGYKTPINGVVTFKVKIR